ncbi:hypothetical protein HTZ77_19765 [Nonomuraea sp. SMC257]|uniref:Uncharacterized protein n=1 Tax=Nonomuraea montanisoli TaxID=2741721 RepID=A0A7Y6IB17_9ACTN|nr:hypothetical protein [Nonomuraea montanisoli]NUW33654.1 hypothetical protein [Nonomuraea montanisoli]
MNGLWSKVGCRATIAQMRYSPERTRDCAAWLVGRQATVVGIVRHGAYALIELDGEREESPGGVLRWPVHWDDLEIYNSLPQPGQADVYRLGLSKGTRRAIQHAVPADSTVSLCGMRARPLPLLEWSLPFVPTAARACSECVLELEQRAKLAAVSGRTSPEPR